VVYAHPGTILGWSEYLWIQVQSRDGQSISGSRDTLTRGVVCIPVQSWDGQSISRFRDTLTRGLCVVYAHPSTIPGWPEYLWIPGYSDKGGCVHPGTIPGWSEYLWIPGYSDKGGCVWCMPIPYNPGMARVSLDTRIL